MVSLFYDLYKYETVDKIVKFVETSMVFYEMRHFLRYSVHSPSQRLLLKAYKDERKERNASAKKTCANRQDFVRMDKFNVNPKQTGLFANWYGRGGGQNLPLPLCNFCLDGPFDLKFGMQTVLGKISRYREKNPKKIARKLLKMLISAFFEDLFHRNRAFARNAIQSVTDVIFQFCFHL